VLATPSLQPVHQPSLAAVSASNGARPNDHVRPGLQTNAPQGARSVGQGRRHSDGRWVLHDWRGNTFRFVVCRNSIQSTMALQLRVSNHRWQPHDEQADRKIDPRRAVAKAELDQGSVRRHDARPAGAPSPNASNRNGGSIEVVWWRARPNCVFTDAGCRASHLVRSLAGLLRKGSAFEGYAPAAARQR